MYSVGNGNDPRESGLILGPTHCALVYLHSICLRVFVSVYMCMSCM
jgi:hypothetical protein